MELGLVKEHRNSSGSSYLGIPMIRPEPDDTEKVACPLFFLSPFFLRFSFRPLFITNYILKWEVL